MSGPSSCPESARWRQMLDDALPREEQAQLDAHLQTCGRCQKLLEGLVAGQQSWQEASDVLSRKPVTATEPELERALARLEGRPCEQWAAGDKDTCDLDFLEPATRPGSLGRLGTYEILAVVGQGGMGIVLKAFDDTLHRITAVKVMAPALAASSQARKRFIREAQAAAAVVHDHVVTIHAVHDVKLPYLVMQFVDGISVEGKIQRTGPFEVKEILRIGMQMAAGLAAAHAQGLVHRDIKPANILLENGIQRVKITDFGLARMVDSGGLTQSGVVAGTPAYMAPEQARGEALDHRADLFSLGSVLYAMCVGHAPFLASTNLAILRRVCDELPAPIRDINPAIPEELSAVIEKLHSKDPADRYQSATEVAEILGAQLASLQQGRGLATPVAQAPSSKKRKQPTVGRQVAPWLFGLVGIALGVAGSLWYFGFGSGRGESVGKLERGSPPPSAGLAVSPLVCTGHSGGIRDVVFSPDATTFASAGDDKTVRIWNARTGEVKFDLRGHENTVRALAFSPNGATLASASAAGDVRLWDVATGQQKDMFSGGPSGLFAVAFSPDGSLVAFAGANGIIHLWDLHRREERLLTEDVGVNFIRRLAFSPDGKSLVDAGNQITCWNLETGDKRWSVGFANTSALVFGSGGNYLVAASWKAGVLALIDISDGRQIGLWHAQDSDLEGLALSPDGSRLISVGQDGIARIWDPRQQRLLGQWQAHTGRISQAVFSPDGKILVTGGSEDRLVKAWDLAKIDESPPAPADEALAPAFVKRILMAPGGEIRSVAFTRDGSAFAAGGDDKLVRIWNPTTGELLHTLSGHERGIDAVAFSPDGLTLASCCGDPQKGEILLWKVKSGEQVGALDGHKQGVFDVAFSPDGKFLASVGWDKTVLIHDLETRMLVLSVKDKQDVMNRRVGFTSDGRTVFTCGNVLSLYDAQTGKPQLFISHAETSDLKLSPKGDLLAAAAWKSGKITLFEFNGGKSRASWQAHRANVHALAFSPDGRVLASTSADGTARIWDVDSQKLRAVLLGHRGPVYAVAFAPDGQTLATAGSQDGKVILWDVSALHARSSP